MIDKGDPDALRRGLHMHHTSYALPDDADTAEVHDYVDEHVGVLAAMWRKRSRFYTQLGFTAVDGGS